MMKSLLRYGLSAAVAAGVCAVPGDARAATRPPKGDFLGCHEYCRQAGGFGGNFEFKPITVAMSAKDITLVDGMLPVTVRCLTAAPCRGAILVMPRDGWIGFGSSDLAVAGRSERTIAVKVPRNGVAELRAKGVVRAVVAVEFGDPACPDGSHDACVLGKDVTLHSR